MVDISARILRVIDELSGNEALLEMLDSESASEMLNWGIELATALVERTAELDDVSAEQELLPRLNMVRRIMRSVGNWVAGKYMSFASRVELRETLLENFKLILAQGASLPAREDLDRLLNQVDDENHTSLQLIKRMKQLFERSSMTLYVSSEYQANPNRPYTHALVIGVGLYRHLPTETGQVGPLGDQITAYDFGLKQLTSPPASARAFADWIIRQFNNDAAPLGTLELLTSEEAPTPFDLPDGSHVQPLAANLNNVEHAFKAWRERCDRHRGNIAIFYYCGHGVLVLGDQVLLLEDYGADEWQWFEASINVGKMQQGMESCKAGLQCFFVDACSNVPGQPRDMRAIVGQSWADATWPAQEDRQPITLVLKAAVEGKGAVGTPGKVSRFTRALIQCLEGRACRREGDRWVVTTTNLVDSVYRVVESLNKVEESPALIPKAAPVARGLIHCRHDPPIVPVVIQLRPNQALSHAELQLETIQPSQWQRKRDPAPQPWEPDNVPAGTYFLRAQFRSPLYKNLKEVLPVEPPGPEDISFLVEEAE